MDDSKFVNHYSMEARQIAAEAASNSKIALFLSAVSLVITAGLTLCLLLR